MGRTSFAVVAALSLVILFTPASAVPVSPPGTDKVVHFVLFVLLALTAVLAGWSRGSVLLGGLLYAAISEVLQASITGLHRSGGVLDWAADAVGVIAGLVITVALRQRTARR